MVILNNIERAFFWVNIRLDLNEKISRSNDQRVQGKIEVEKTRISEKLHNIIHIHNNVLWDKKIST